VSQTQAEGTSTTIEEFSSFFPFSKCSRFQTITTDLNRASSQASGGHRWLESELRSCEEAWQKDCGDLNRTRTAWEDARKQITEFNAMLVKNNLQEMKVAPTKLTVSACSFMP
jgi:hypothetical protein